MELKDYFHMNEGDGELSYSQNSSTQMEVFLMNQQTLESAIQSIISEDESPSKALNVADLGCGVGPTPLAFVSSVMKNVQRECKGLKWEIQIYMNDLPSNDFNSLFRALFNLEAVKKKDGVPLCFLTAVPGSYYDRLFPKNSLHFVHANYTLHWFSQVPQGLYSEEGEAINKGNVYISEKSEKAVAEAYMGQFKQDLNHFLKCRSEEVVPDAGMLLTFRGRPSSSDALTWQPWELKIFTMAITCLLSQGLIKEEKLDSFDFPYYCACEEEIQEIVAREGSFAVLSAQTVAHHVEPQVHDMWERSQFIAKFIRAFSESLVLQHFGEDILDPLYDQLAHSTFQYLSNGELAEHHTVTILLRKY